jgi:hypothetical protein
MCQNLEELKRNWGAIIADHGDQVRDASVPPKDPKEFQQLMQALSRHSGLAWFCYPDRAASFAAAKLGSQSA